MNINQILEAIAIVLAGFIAMPLIAFFTVLWLFS